VTDARRGGALVLTVLVLLLLELLAHGALVLALRHERASVADRGLLEARTAARGAVLAIPGAVAGLPLDSVPVGDTVSGGWMRRGGAPVPWSLRRVSGEGWVGEARAAPEGGAWHLREGRVFWHLLPEARTAALTGAAEVGELRAGDLAGTVEGWGPGGGCEGAAPEALPSAGLRPWARVPLSGPLGGPEGDPRDGLDAAVLGLLTWEDLLAGIPGRIHGSGTPAPREASGSCVEEDPWNWGDPIGLEGSPCAGHQAWRAAPGDLRVASGVGQGVVVALGDVELAGTDFRGLLLVGGDLTLRGGAVVTGAVRVGGRLLVEPTARISGTPCPVLAALRAAPEPLRGLRLRPGVGWLPIP
jgi:hypothetical protein